MRVALAGFLLAAPPVWAETIEIDPPDMVFNASNHSLFTSTRNLENEDASPELLRSETHLRAETGRYNLGAILSNRFAVAKQDGADIPIVLEKKFINFESDEWRVTLGDSHHEVGRGIALALFRDETFGIDSTVEGGSVQYSPTSWDFKVFGGRAKSLFAPVTLIPFQSPLFNREIWLGHVGVKHKWAQTQLGAHYVLTLNRPLSTMTIDKRWHTGGVTLNAEGFAPGWDAYAEANVMANEVVGSSTNGPTAYGSYGSLIFSPVPWKFKLEARDYRNYQYDFHRPPTMEEDIVTSLNFSNITAARLSVERRVGVLNTVRASLLAGNDRILNTTVRHAVAALKWKFGDVAVEGRSGYRWLQGQSDLLHGDIKTKIPTFSGQFIELGYRKLHGFNNLNVMPTLDDRNFFDLAYTFSPHWSVNVGVEYVPSNPTDIGQQFLNVGSLVKVDSFTSRAFVGATSGGPQCSGGICRMVPAYSGMMVEGTYAF